MTPIISYLRDLLIVVYLTRTMHLSQFESVCLLAIALAAAYWIDKR